jgi:1,4-alpha-glucan branching enzyme
MACRQHPAPHVADDRAVVHGQEWAASSPFQYFTDLEPGLGALVTEGRRREFEYFPEFTDPVARLRIPDPQDAATFERSTLDWSEREQPAHAQSLALYTDLLRLRNTHRALGATEEDLDRSGGHRRRDGRHAAQRRRRAVPGCRPA